MSVFLSFLSGIALFFLFPFFPFSTGALCITAAAALVFRRRFLPLFLIVLGLAYAAFKATPVPDPADVAGRELRMTGRFVPGRETSASGSAMRTFKADSVTDEDSGDEMEELGDKEVTVFSDAPVDYEHDYELRLTSGKDRSRMDPGWRREERLSGMPTALRQAGAVSFSFTALLDRYRDRLDRYALEHFSADAAGLIISVTTGKMDYLGDRQKDAFSRTGLAHILSISGTHFGLFSVMLFGLFTFLINHLPHRMLLRLTLYTTPRELAAILTLPFMVFYLGLSGSSPPAVRSFVMISLFLAGLLLGRKGAWLNSLCFAAFVLALWDPKIILSLSFQLSFLAVLVIGAFAGTDRERPDETVSPVRRVLRFLGYSILLTLVVTAGTSPLVAYHFHYLSLISPAANLVASPLIGSVLVALALISSFSYLLTGVYLLKPLVGLVAGWSVGLVQELAAIPHADIAIPAFPPVLCALFYAGCLPYFLFGRKRGLLILPFVPVVVFAVFSFFEHDPLRITFVDVGQGDSAIVHLPDKKTLVVDTGRTGKETAAVLKYNGIRNIDGLVLTHSHPDHAGGEEYLRTNFGVREIWRGNSGFTAPEDIGPDTSGIRQRSLERGDILRGDGYEISVLHPYPGFYTLGGDEFTSENNASVVLRLAGKKHAFLLAGDVEEEAEENLTHLGKWLKSDIIKVPHHGGRTSAEPAFFSAVSPSIAVISVGRENSFGHPRPEMLELLRGKRVLRTDRDGAIEITERGENLEVKTYRDSAFEPADTFKAELRNMRRLFETW
ncbi:MAG: DNA internalization-related competence protein ComEC/Rec2 [Nitrospiraceae bacterium]|nr:DNA internalization-related competence protein ComEC/Rec2 [Nitrospiraceae bacterium]